MNQISGYEGKKAWGLTPHSTYYRWFRG